MFQVDTLSALLAVYATFVILYVLLAKALKGY